MCNSRLKNCRSVSLTVGSLVTKGRTCAKRGKFCERKQMMHQTPEPKPGYEDHFNAETACVLWLAAGKSAKEMSCVLCFVIVPVTHKALCLFRVLTYVWEWYALYVRKRYTDLVRRLLSIFLRVLYGTSPEKHTSAKYASVKKQWLYW